MALTYQSFGDNRSCLNTFIRLVTNILLETHFRVLGEHLLSSNLDQGDRLLLPENYSVSIIDTAPSKGTVFKCRLFNTPGTAISKNRRYRSIRKSPGATFTTAIST